MKTPQEVRNISCGSGEARVINVPSSSLCRLDKGDIGLEFKLCMF